MYNKRAVSDKDKDIRKQGIALVVVLGFLAVLTIMAVGMAISMRTERLASRSYLDMVKARLYCQSALADSMVYLDEAIYAGKPRENISLDRVSPEYLMMPHFRILPSADPNVPAGEKPDFFSGSLIEGTFTNFAPYVIVGEAQLAESMPPSEWIYTTETDAGGNSVTNGRYMYFVLNRQGRLDINYLSLTNYHRPYPMNIVGGTSVEVGRGREFEQWIADRARDVRYETLRDARDKTEDERTFGSYDYFSWFPPMRRIRIDEGGEFPKIGFVREFNDGWPVILSTNSAFGNRQEIIDAFQMVIAGDWRSDGADWQDAEGACDANDLYNLIEDYVDEDWEPHDLKVPNVEAIPMINEIQTHTSNVVVEVWEPFVGPDRYDGEFTVNVHVNGSKDSEKGTIPNIDKDRPIGPIEVDVELATSIPEGGADLTVSIEISSKTGSTVKVDEVVFRGVQRDESWQCNDPRFNHLVSQWKKTSGNTLGDINENADYESNPKSGEYLKDGDYLMYCANKPLRCTGELGYLPVAPWRTIKLYKDPRDDRDNMDPVLDYFTMQARNEVKFGLLAPNCGAGGPIHAALFIRRIITENLPEHMRAGVGLYIDQTTSERTRKVHGWWSKVQNDWKPEFNNGKKGGVVVNPSDVGRILYDDGRINPVKDFNGKSELWMECLMRRASQVFNVRQNIFTVLLWGQTLGSRDETTGDFTVKAEAQAVADVWRDPYPESDDSGDPGYMRHRKFVRFMRWME